MIDYLEQKVSNNALNKIFRKNIDRSIFIGEYPYFTSDGNDLFYEEFIEHSILKHGFKVQEDAIELSIRLNIFKVPFLVEIKKILYSRRQELIKLVCLDWLFYFFREIPENEFIEINEYMYRHSKHDLLIVQSILNMLLCKPNSQLISDLTFCFAESNDPAVFYRLINNLDSNQLAKEFTSETMAIIKEIVISKLTISKKQKNEIFKKLFELAV
jgi:hypothetical protein